MNYPCLQCVLEYLEANQRFRLSSKCPKIRIIERSIPLHLDQLMFCDNAIAINQCEYVLKKTSYNKINGFSPGDIVLPNERTDLEHLIFNYRIVRYVGDWNEKEDLKKFPEGVPLHSAMKWMSCFFFEGRRVITTRRLNILNVTVLRLPVGFKIKVINRLRTSMDYLNRISNFIHPKVEEVILSSRGNFVWENALIQNARQVVIRWIIEGNTDNFLDFTHKNVILSRPLPEGYFERLIRKWMADKREIGSLFWFTEFREKDCLKTLYHFKKMFGGRAVDRKIAEEDSTLRETLSREYWNLWEFYRSNDENKLIYCICLPMNSTSELQISLFSENQASLECKIELKVVPIDSLPTLEFDQVENHFRKKYFIRNTVSTLIRTIRNF